MKTISSLSSPLLVTLAGLILAAAPALAVALVFQSATGAISAFVSSMLVLTVCHDYAPKAPPTLTAGRARALHKYPLAA